MVNASISHRTVGEWALRSDHPYGNPFVDVTADATCTSPSGTTLTVPGYLFHLRRFFTDVAPFHHVQPAPEIILPGEYATGHRPLALATDGADVVSMYLPVGGKVDLSLPEGKDYDAQWYDPRTGELQPAAPLTEHATLSFSAPAGGDENEHPWDWVLVLSA